MPDPAPVPDDVERVNAWVAAQERARGPLIDMDVHGVRRAFTWAPWPAELLRVGLRGASVPVAPPAGAVEQVSIATAGREVPLYVLRPAARASGVLFYVHGGGWMSLHPQDYAAYLWPLAEQCGLTIAMPDYRLAPEAPFPAGPDDCEAAARWCVEQAGALGPGPRLLGGDSAGANLALLTLLRLRDSLGTCPFAGVDLLYGVYDLAGTPSVERSRGDTLSITRALLRRCAHWYVAGAVDLRSPQVSPLYADLHGLPPVLISVGDRDPLLDDSLFLAARWQYANGNATLAVYPGCHHAFDCYPTSAARDCLAARGRFVADALRRAEDAR